jgi:hypothetical protein
MLHDVWEYTPLYIYTQNHCFACGAIVHKERVNPCVGMRGSFLRIASHSECEVTLDTL